MSDIVMEYTCGACPVQAEGTVSGERFYFRARGDRWRIGIGGTDPVFHPAWEYGEPYGEPGGLGAGWMDEEEANAFIRKSVELWKKETGRG